MEWEAGLGVVGQGGVGCGATGRGGWGESWKKPPLRDTP